MSFNLLYFHSVFCLTLLLSSCSFSIPDENIIEHSSYSAMSNDNETALNAASIKIISWNNLAGCRQTIKKISAFTLCNEQQADHSFLELTRNNDLILIQEAYMDSDTLDALKSMGIAFSWDIAVSYIAYPEENIPTGVLTIANARSLSSYSQRSYDVILPTPKAILFTRYHLTDKTISSNKLLDEKLLVVNIHGILFSKKNLYKQLQLMTETMSHHKGPVILAGDFNTMTSKSYLKLIEIVGSIGMIEAENTARTDHRVKSLFGQQYDFIFYKKLKLIDSYSVNLKESTLGKTSDHNPLYAEFKVLNSNRSPTKLNQVKD